MLQFFKRITPCLLTLFFFIFISCQKEKNWYTTITATNSKNHNSVNLEVEFAMPRNNNYLYAGLCATTSPNPTVENSVFEAQYLNSETDDIEITGLYVNTTYHIRSYIKPKKGDIIYSDDYSVTTFPLPNPPCPVSSGIINISGSDESSGTLIVNASGDTYKMSLSTSIGTIDFVFAEEPVTGIYSTVSSTSFLETFEVSVTGILGTGFTCYYGGSSEMGLYLTNSGDGNIKIQFCDLIFITSQSCSETFEFMGDIHN